MTDIITPDEATMPLTWPDVIATIKDAANSRAALALAVEYIENQGTQLDTVMAMVEDYEASAGLKCPDCDDTGHTVEVGHDGNGSPVGEPVWCEFCHKSPFSVYNQLDEDSG